jgi:hypothetical protein
VVFIGLKLFRADDREQEVNDQEDGDDADNEVSHGARLDDCGDVQTLSQA